MASDRLGAFEVTAYSGIKFTRVAPEEDLVMDVQVAESALEFGQEPRQASEVAMEWTRIQEVLIFSG